MMRRYYTYINGKFKLPVVYTREGRLPDKTIRNILVHKHGYVKETWVLYGGKEYFTEGQPHQILEIKIKP